jgi:NADP-dependent 3-hydroxy acid dehydrogenase YdfG
MGSLAGKVYVVSGAAGAIAEAIGETFHAAGVKLALLDREERLLKERAARWSALPLAVDLAQAEAAREALARVERELGPVDGLIHTVGGFAAGPLAEATPELFDTMFDLNVRTLFHLVKAALPGLLARQEGFIAGIAAGPAWSGRGPGMALYAASKAAMATLLRSLEGELAGSRIRVAILYPMGTVDTPANRREMPGADVRLWIDPRELAETLLFAATRGERGRLVELPVYPGFS